MKNPFKIANIVIVLLLMITLISNFILWQYPLQYLEYKTGYKAETINNLLEERHERLVFSPSEHEKMCKNFSSKEVVKAYGELYFFSFSLIGISFFVIIFFVLVLRFSKSNSFKASNKFAIIGIFILFVSVSMFFLADLREWDLDFWLVCYRGNATNGFLFQ